MPDSAITPEQLRDKALLALEDAVQECRYRTPRRSYAIRFALTYLYATGGSADRRPYENLWRSLGRDKSPWSFSVADTALLCVYRAVGVTRGDAAGQALWRRWTIEEGHGGQGS